MPNNSSHKELTTGTASALREFFESFVLGIKRGPLTTVFSANDVRDIVVKVQIDCLHHTPILFDALILPGNLLKAK